MNLDEYPLLNRSDLMLTVLRAAARGDAGLGDCLAGLRGIWRGATRRRRRSMTRDLLVELGVVAC